MKIPNSKSQRKYFRPQIFYCDTIKIEESICNASAHIMTSTVETDYKESWLIDDEDERTLNW